MLGNLNSEEVFYLVSPGLTADQFNWVVQGSSFAEGGGDPPPSFIHFL